MSFDLVKPLQAALERVEDIGEVKDIRDRAEALRVYARQSAAGLDAQNDCWEVKLRAERRAGELLAEIVEAHRPAKLSQAATVLPDGITRSQSSRWQKLWQIPEEAFERYLARTDGRTERATAAFERSVRLSPKSLDGNAAREATDYRLIHSPCAELDLTGIDAVVTDPPYPRKHLDCYADLSELGARVLQDGGSVFAMAGQSYLPSVMERLGQHLAYWWTLSYAVPGANVKIWPRRVLSGWKPVLWYVKGEYGGGGQRHDVLKSPGDDKTHHHWGQSYGGMLDLIERYTEPGQTVLDPFCGGGATGAACLALGRHFVGADIDELAVGTTAERLAA